MRTPVRLPFLDLARPGKWIDRRTPLLTYVPPYLQRLLSLYLDSYGPTGLVCFTLWLYGAGKKNMKSLVSILFGLFKFLAYDSPGGNDGRSFANDQAQSLQNKDLAERLIHANPMWASRVLIQKDRLVRRDGMGSWVFLPKDAPGSHGGTALFETFDEIHALRDWALLEANQLDASRPDAQMLITSYNTIYTQAGTPLVDLLKLARGGTDERLLFSWFAADGIWLPPGLADVAESFTDASPEDKANPCKHTWADPGYLATQAKRLPSHLYRRLHLNLAGLPAGSAFDIQPVEASIDKGIESRPPERLLVQAKAYTGFVDMSGGSGDDATLAIGHVDRATGQVVVDLVINQGPPPPFDPRGAVHRFVQVLAQYGIRTVYGDAYGGQIFRAHFGDYGIYYVQSPRTTSQLYEALLPRINSSEVRLPDVETLQSQLLGLVWRGQKITHPIGEFDDWATSCAGVVAHVSDPRLDGRASYRAYSAQI